MKSGILDPQGKAIEGALKSLGVDGVASVRQGKVFDIELSGADKAKAEAALKDAADKLLGEYRDRELPGRIAGMRLAVAVVIGLIAAATPSSLSAQQLDCRGVAAEAASFLRSAVTDCTRSPCDYGKQARPAGHQAPFMSRYHGGFYVSCPVEPMCENEPAIGGWFIQPANWSSGPKDAQAIYQVMRTRWAFPMGRRQCLPSHVRCSMFRLEAWRAGAFVSLRMRKVTMALLSLSLPMNASDLC